MLDLKLSLKPFAGKIVLWRRGTALDKPRMSVWKWNRWLIGGLWRHETPACRPSWNSISLGDSNCHLIIDHRGVWSRCHYLPQLDNLSAAAQSSMSVCHLVCHRFRCFGCSCNIWRIYSYLWGVAPVRTLGRKLSPYFAWKGKIWIRYPCPRSNWRFSVDQKWWHQLASRA